ncbi:MAG TPA: hypothetical protein VFW62_02485 [bacterium]|nr:hypothetical protein [bacterium]
MNFAFAWILILLFAAPTLQAQVLEQSFSDSEAGFRISTPSGQWHLEPRGVDPGPIRAMIRFESALDQFVPNVTVRVTELEDPKIKAEQALRQDLESLPPNVEVLERKKLQAGAVPGFELLIHDPNNRKVFQQRFFIAKGKSFVITCTSDKESYSRMRRDFQKILDSFAIL